MERGYASSVDVYADGRTIVTAEIKKDFQLPNVGITAAFRPCSECYEILEREQRQMPGGRQECVMCRNVLVAKLLEKTVDPVADRFRPFEASARTDILADVMFDSSRFSIEMAKAWLDANNLLEFADKGRDGRVQKYLRFSRDESAPVDMYVRLDKGVIGRCTTRETKFTFSGPAAK